MDVIPSIKGSLFARAVEDLLKLVTDGQISQVELEAKLDPEDVRYLDESIWTGGWYDVEAYGRILEVLKEVAGEGRDEYLRRRGEESAELFLEKGLHQQLEYLSRLQLSSASDPEERFQAFGRDLKLLVSLHKAIFNFGDHNPKVDPEHERRYLIELTGAEPYPDAVAWTAIGFINRMAKQHDESDLWTWERPSPDVVHFRMTRPV